MKSGRMVRASDCQYQSRNNSGCNPSILRHSGSRGAADETVLNKGLQKSCGKAGKPQLRQPVPVQYIIFSFHLGIGITFSHHPAQAKFSPSQIWSSCSSMDKLNMTNPTVLISRRPFICIAASYPLMSSGHGVASAFCNI
jgi:hypothetical protein